MTRCQKWVKRGLDILAALLGLVLLAPLLVLGYLVALFSSRQGGFYRQVRVGRNGRLFHLLKLRTMRDMPGLTTTVTSRHDPRITRCGAWLRRLKIDELPQLWHVLKGDMSLVGPRPDVPGFADKLGEKDRLILSVRPGITGPATLKYRDEEELLAGQPDPETYNREVIWPDKVRINREYVENYSLVKDFYYLFKTIIR